MITYIKQKVKHDNANFFIVLSGGISSPHQKIKKLCPWEESNLRPSGPQPDALSTELQGLNNSLFWCGDGPPTFFGSQLYPCTKAKLSVRGRRSVFTPHHFQQ
jgi:hypothetical protein